MKMVGSSQVLFYKACTVQACHKMVTQFPNSQDKERLLRETPEIHKVYEFSMIQIDTKPFTSGKNLWECGILDLHDRMLHDMADYTCLSSNMIAEVL